MQIQNLKMKTKILLLAGALCLIFAIFVGLYLIPTMNSTIDAQTETRLSSLVDVSYSTVEKYYAAFEKGEMTEDEAKQMAIKEIQAFRHGKGDYFFINDYNNVCIMHPISAKLIGQELSGLKDPNGVYIFKEMTEVAKTKGSGFVKYVWDKPGSESPVPKISYVRGFDKWQWVVGTGVYVDDLKAVQMALLRNVVIGVFAIMVVSVLIALKMAATISRPLVRLKGVAEQLAAGDMSVELDVDALDEVGDLSRSFSQVIDSIKRVVEETRVLDEKITYGVLHSSIDESAFSGGWAQIISGINSVTGTLEGHIRKTPAIMMALDKDKNVLYLNDSGLATVGLKQVSEIKGKKCYDLFKTDDCQTENCACTKSMKDGMYYHNETIARPLGVDIHVAYDAMPIKNKKGDVVGAFELVVDQTEMKKAAKLQEEYMMQQLEMAKVKERQSMYQDREVSKLVESINELAQGHLNFDLATEESNQETKEIDQTFSQIYSSLKNMTDAIRSYISEMSDVLSRMNNKDFDISITREYLGDFVAIKASINELVDSLNEKLSEINEAAEQVLAGSNQVSQSAQHLSQGATEQAASVEEITSMMAQVFSQTKTNAQSAEKANVLSTQIHAFAEEGNQQMTEMLRSMKEINESSTNISKIIKVIDEIAFQTNILALNAAVEAARAGEHGKGFAVVAEEVRNLAARSAAAARETTDMIENSMSKVQAGTSIANETSTALQKIVSSVAESGVIVSDISQASKEQSHAISEANEGIQQISNVTQMNAATAEECAAASEEMSSQAHILSDITGEFKLKRPKMYR